MAELDIVKLYRQDLDELYKRYAKVYNICAFSVAANITGIAAFMIYYLSTRV